MAQEGYSPVLIFHSPVLVLWVVTSSLKEHRLFFYQYRKYPKY